jgi:transposase
MKILSLDMGKFKTVWLVYLTGGVGEKQYGKIATGPKEVHDLLVEHQPDRLVLESGPSAGWVCDLAAALSIPAQVANTNDERWHWKKSKKKTDRIDALKIAQMSEMGCLPMVHVPTPKVRQWRELISYRHGLVDRRTAVKNSIRAIFDRRGERLPRGNKAWGVAGVKQLRAEARELCQCGADELWRGQLHEELQQLESMEKNIATVESKLDELAGTDERIKRLRTAPCVGPRTSELVLTALDDPHRFKTTKQVGAYAGLSPRQWQSGQSLREGHISRMGNPLLREVLVEICWLGIRTDPWMKQVYEGVRRGSDKRKKIAITALSRRLLIRLWAMLRDGTDWVAPALRAEVSTVSTQGMSAAG